MTKYEKAIRAMTAHKRFGSISVGRYAGRTYINERRMMKRKLLIDDPDLTWLRAYCDTANEASGVLLQYLVLPTSEGQILARRQMVATAQGSVGVFYSLAYA